MARQRLSGWPYAKVEKRRTFGECHHELVDTSFPWRLQSMRSERRAKITLAVREHTHPLLSWDADLPFEQIHRTIRSFGWFRVESLAESGLRRHFHAYSEWRITYEWMVLPPLLPFLSKPSSADSGHREVVSENEKRDEADGYAAKES